MREFEKKSLIILTGFSSSGFDASKSELNEGIKKCEQYVLEDMVMEWN